MPIDFVPSLTSAVSGAVGAGVGGFCSYLGIRASARAQIATNIQRVEGDLRLQAERLKDAKTNAEVMLKRAKLEEIYVFLSEADGQCSQSWAMRYYQMGRDLNEQEAHWNTLNSRVHIVRSLIEIYFPKISVEMRGLIECINSFHWENREFQQTDHETEGDNERWMTRWRQIIHCDREMGCAVKKVRHGLAREAEELAMTG